MRYAVLLSLLGAAQVALGFQVGRWAPLFWWSGGSWILVGCAYGFLGPGVFGKRSDGRLTCWSTTLLFPFLAMTWILWHLQRLASREKQCVEVSPGLWLGRRCLSHELPPGIQLVADLTCEFSEPRGIVQRCRYLCLPTLDGAAPQEDRFRELVQTIAEFERPVYVHCALGHGRSATVVAAVLLARGICNTADEAELAVKEVRPGIEINQAQRSLLRRMFERAEYATATENLRLDASDNTAGKSTSSTET